MINQLDDMIRHLLVTRLNDPPLPWTVDVEVRPPDDQWRAAVNANGRPGVSVYLADVREERRHRSTAAHDRVRPEPFRVNCHYIVSCWIPTTDTSFATPTTVEDWLLGEVLLVLVDAAPINATRVYGGAPPPTVAANLVDNDLETVIAPPEGFPNLADFWTGVGQGNTWHPSAHLVVTLPMERVPLPVGPPVTTLHTTFFPGTGGDLVGGDVVIHIGGTVRDTASQPVAGAWVRLADPSGAVVVQSAATDDAGRFRLYGLSPGPYRLSAGSAAHPPQVAAITVPDPLGSYDVTLT